MAPFGQILACLVNIVVLDGWQVQKTEFQHEMNAMINMFSLVVVFSFLQDSLDLSHDEIHRSLQANMAANRSNGHAVDLNPMEFIEQNGGKIFSNAFFKFRFQNSCLFGFDFSLITYEN